MKQLCPRLSPVVLLAALSAQAPADTSAAIIVEGRDHPHVMAFEDYLCNHIGARLTGSDNFTLACEWARGEFAKMGLDARLEKWGEWNIVWNRGQWAGRVVEPFALELQVATPAWSAPTKGVVRGTLVAMPQTAAELAAITPRLSEVYLFGERPGRKSEIRSAFREAIAATPPLGYVQSARSTGYTDKRFENQIRVFGNSNVARGSWERLPTVPEIVVRDDQAARLAEQLAAGVEPVVEFDIRNRFRRGPITLNNVVADLPGTDKPDEFVIVCGHLDSWHQAAGATDNGTGTTSTLEAARILSAVGARPSRTIRFILWGGEEQGLLGSREYVKRNRAEMKSVSAVFNHDTGTNWAHSLSVTAGMYDMMREVLQPVMTLAPPEEGFDGPVFELRKVESIGGGGGSDHASFLSAGVPAWSWGLRGRASYGYGWHSQWDTYDIVIPEYQRHTATVIALTALGVANLPELLPRDGIRRGGDRRASLAAFLESRFGVALDDDLRVTRVVAQGPAAAAGVQKGDVLKQLWADELATQIDVYMAWRNRSEDAESIEFKVQRGDVILNLAAPLRGEPASDAKAGGAGQPKKKGENPQDGAGGGPSHRVKSPQ